jgi:osmotically-inducible protein OsmY
MFDRSKKGNTGKIVVLGGVAALAVYLFDPKMGKTRRAKLKDQIGGYLRRGARGAARKSEYARGQLEGARAASSSDSPPENDPVLVDKVKSEVLRRSKYPTGQIAVTAADGIVELRGECESREQISELEQEVRKITGVVDVHNYLHLPGEEPPNKEEALRVTRS